MARTKGKLFGIIGKPLPRPARPVTASAWQQR